MFENWLQILRKIIKNVQILFSYQSAASYGSRETPGFAICWFASFPPPLNIPFPQYPLILNISFLQYPPSLNIPSLKPPPSISPIPQYPSSLHILPPSISLSLNIPLPQYPSPSISPLPQYPPSLDIPPSLLIPLPYISPSLLIHHSLPSLIIWKSFHRRTGQGSTEEFQEYFYD